MSLLIYHQKLSKIFRINRRRLIKYSTSSNASTKLGTNRSECSYPISGKSPIIVENIADAFQKIKSGDNLYVQAVGATPTPLLSALCDHAKANHLKGLTLQHIVVDGPANWTDETFKGIIRSNPTFIGANIRPAVDAGNADFMSIFISEVPLLFQRQLIHLNASLIQVSPPDANGYCTLGINVDCTRAAVNNCDMIIALSNPNMPRTFGDSLIHVSHIDVLVNGNSPIHESAQHTVGDDENRIAQLIAENLIDDGATLQMGIGAIPDAALSALKHHRHLGVHSEMISNGVIELIECNAITNSQKKIHPGKVVTSFVYGSRKLYDYVDDNPLFYLGDIQWVNNPSIIAQNPKVSAINAAIEVDLTGQVVSDSVGSRFYSGFGGQVDFIYGAALSHDGLGKPIIALSSQTKKGQSKIVPFIKEGAGVVTSRAHVHYVVTEYGIAQLFGRNMRQRAHALINIAHPAHRAHLENCAFERLKVMPSSD